MNTRSHATASASVPASVTANVAPSHSNMDRDIDAMLRKSQPGNFSGEGKQVGKQLEEWIEKMEDYFDLAHSTAESKAMIARFKLEKSTQSYGGRIIAQRTVLMLRLLLGLTSRRSSS